MGYSNPIGESYISDISTLSYVTNLKELYIYNGENITDLSVLPKLTNLQRLVVAYAKSSNITSIDLTDGTNTLSNLQKLSVYQNTNIKKINGLDSISGLTTLQVCNTGLTSIDGLSNHTGLTALALYNNQISDLSELDKLIENCGGTVGFKSLSLYDNSIGYDSTNDNVQTILNLYNAGCKYINIRGNAIAEDTRLQGISGIVVE